MVPSPDHGSSPPARGTRSGCPTASSTRRFIPARAGNTRSRQPTSQTPSVHPRPRGEHDQFYILRKADDGSSPPARGTLPRASAPARRLRFIPARAGNTEYASQDSRPAPVHPRPRGEHPFDPPEYREPLGSSPPARGTHPIRCCPRRCPRFIPARAGNTPPSPRSPRSPPVHPRPRGEHSVRAGRPFALRGSSPPARGTPSVTSARMALFRFIPARAGNTLPTTL